MTRAELCVEKCGDLHERTEVLAPAAQLNAAAGCKTLWSWNLCLLSYRVGAIAAIARASEGARKHFLHLGMRVALAGSTRHLPLARGRLSMTVPTYALPLEQIVIDDALQPRCEGISEAHVTALMELPENWPPIVVVPQGDSLMLVDGFHRYEAATRLAFGSIAATIRERPPDGDLLRVAFELNAAHGRPLSLADRKNYALSLFTVHPDYSDREIGRRTGLNHETVGALRNQKTQTPLHVPARRPGELNGDVSLFDPIRFSKATREQKAVAGYIKRLAVALSDPYEDENGVATLAVWSKDPNEIAEGCFAAMGAERASKILTTLESDAKFIVAVAKAGKAIQVTS